MPGTVLRLGDYHKENGGSCPPRIIDPNERKRVNKIITDYLRARKEMHRVLRKRITKL